MAIRDHSPRKKLFSEWTNRGVIGLGVVLLLLGVPMCLWLMTYRSDIAVGMWIVTWLSLTFFVLLMAKKSVSDPGYRIDKKIIDRTREEIEAHRLAVRKELLANEIAALERGEKTPVLDVWRLDALLAKRHPFFESTTALLMDPGDRELRARIQIGEVGRTEEERKLFTPALFRDVTAYLRIIARDPYLWLERKFFDGVVLIVDAMHEDDRHTDVPFPVLSVLLDADVLWSIRTIEEFDRYRLRVIAQVRFDEGREIEPHRIIDLPASRGAK